MRELCNQQRLASAALTALTLATILAGCAQTMSMKVDALHQATPAGNPAHTYCVVPANVAIPALPRHPRS